MNEQSPEHTLPTAGLANYGNFCYLNSSIQCLRTLKPLIQYFNETSNQNDLLHDIIKKFSATDVNKLQQNQRLYKTIAYYMDIYYTENPDPENTYINPDADRVMALEDIYGKDPPSQLISVKPHVVNNTIMLIEKIREKHELSRQHMYNTIRKLALHLDKIYLFITLHALLIDMELSGKGEANSILNPKEVITTLHIATKDSIEYAHLCNGQQNDASELITVLLDFLHETHAYPKNLNIDKDIIEMTPEQIIELPINEQISVGVCQSVQRLYANSYTELVNRMFFFTLQVTRCGNDECKHTSMSYAPDNTLSIPIYIDDIAKKVSESTPEFNHEMGSYNMGQPMSRATVAAMRLRQTTLLEYRKMGNRRKIELDADPISIYDCLNDHFKRDPLDDYKCEKCENKERNYISRALVNLPKVLIISLKRFQTIDNFGRRAKVYRRVTYPMVLDVSKYCASPIENGTYKLIAVNLHSGGVDGGHYTAMTFNSNLDAWYYYNDQHVQPLGSPADALNHMNAYILFYEKI